MQLVQTKANLDSHLAGCIESLLFVQLIAIYFHDTAMLNLVMGTVLQLTILSSRMAAISAVVHSNKRQIIVTVAIFNTFCVCQHLIYGAPQPTSHERYLHGGLSIEFVGEQAFSSRLSLVVWDSVVVLLQALIFCVNFGEKETDGGHLLGQADGDEQVESADIYSGQLTICRISLATLYRRWVEEVPAAEESPSGDGGQVV